MEREGNAFYVVRKGDIVAIYKSLSDCQAQVSPSVCDPPVSVYKGYSLRQETEEYLASRGLKNASYAINEADAYNELFGNLVPCPFKDLFGSASVSTEDTKKDFRLGPGYYIQEAKSVSYNHEVSGSASVSRLSTEDTKMDFRLGPGYYIQEAKPVSYNHESCIIEFDGASKGNPGKAGAGAILRTGDGQLVCHLREGLGVVTNNVAEYRSLILGLKYALKKGFKRVHALGDSQLVCMQVQGIWQTKHQNMIELCKEAKELINKFLSFQINHVRRELNSKADAQANLAIILSNGEIVEEGGGSL